MSFYCCKYALKTSCFRLRVKLYELTFKSLLRYTVRWKQLKHCLIVQIVRGFMEKLCIRGSPSHSFCVENECEGNGILKLLRIFIFSNKADLGRVAFTTLRNRRHIKCH